MRVTRLRVVMQSWSCACSIGEIRIRRHPASSIRRSFSDPSLEIRDVTPRGDAIPVECSSRSLIGPSFVYPDPDRWNLELYA